MAYRSTGAPRRFAKKHAHYLITIHPAASKDLYDGSYRFSPEGALQSPKAESSSLSL